jgi:hypothetical protein
MPSLPPAIVRPLLAAAVVLAALVAATQWTAALLAYHPALGAPWLDLLGLKVYAPWNVADRRHALTPIGIQARPAAQALRCSATLRNSGLERRKTHTAEGSRLHADRGSKFRAD